MDPTSPRRARILIVEDEDLIRRLLQRTLTTRGWETSAVPGGEAALCEAARVEFDAVVCDLMMEGLDGFQTLSRLKEAHPALVCVVMTAFDTPENRLKAERLGAGGFVAKPFGVDELDRLLRSLLGV
ncbi:MAG: response regulator [Elusimicrobiota bacterium]|jgi:DNA-binding response OmpR family regulator